MRKSTHPLVRWLRRHQRPLVVGLVLLALGLPAVIPDGRDGPHVTFFDVGQGDAVHIRAEQGFDVVIDGGPMPDFARLLAADLPAGDRTIELLVLTHPHADHLAGLLSLFKRFRVEGVVTTVRSHDSQLFQRWTEQLVSSHVSTFHPVAGQVLAIPGGRLTVLWPPDEGVEEAGRELNSSSIVLRIDLDGQCVLLMGDATAAVEEQLPIDQLRCSALKVGHHGSATSSGQSFLDAVRPSVAVVSVGAKNRYGHPAPSTVRRLERSAGSVYRTDQDGTVRIFFSGDRGVSVRTSRKHSP